MTEEKCCSQDSIPDLISLNSGDFNDLWADCMATFEPIALDVLRDVELTVEDTSSVMHFDQIHMIPCENSSDNQTVQFDQIHMISNENSSDNQIVQSGTADDMPSHPGPSYLGAVPLASLIATTNWPGQYGFNIHFDDPKQQPSKGANWLYSSRQDKLYVKKDVPCPIKFETNQHIAPGASIKVMAVFDDARYASDIVQRCYNHYSVDTEKGIPFAKHLIKCECQQACYEEDSESNRLSVSVQYENPQSGEMYSTYIFKFTCLGSCSGGINRRPIKVVFTLEHGGVTIGRRTLDVRICACPRRDLSNDEKRLFNIKEEKRMTNDKSSKRKRPKSDDDEETPLYIGGQHTSKKSKCSTSPPNGPYCITTNDRKQYHFLKQMQKLYLMYDTFKSGPPHARQCFFSLLGSSESSTEEKGETDESDC